MKPPAGHRAPRVIAGKDAVRAERKLPDLRRAVNIGLVWLLFLAVGVLIGQVPYPLLLLLCGTYVACDLLDAARIAWKGLP